uniref:Uncharacterized protein n=1 Tax=Anguilla anguilla TaxID=7936 RepID=A0A0E9T8Q5_ANGAN
MEEMREKAKVFPASKLCKEPQEEMTGQRHCNAKA